MNEIEWRYFLAGPSGEVQIPSNPTTWISENAWPDIFRQFQGMSLINVFQGIDKDLIDNSEQWRNIFDSNNAQDEPLPDIWNNKLDSF